MPIAIGGGTVTIIITDLAHVDITITMDTDITTATLVVMSATVEADSASTLISKAQAASKGAAFFHTCGSQVNSIRRPLPSVHTIRRALPSCRQSIAESV